MNNNNKQIVKPFECNVCVFVRCVYNILCCVMSFFLLLFMMTIGKYTLRFYRSMILIPKATRIIAFIYKSIKSHIHLILVFCFLAY